MEGPNEAGMDPKAPCQSKDQRGRFALSVAFNLM
jgi:hypothetical protein